MKRVRRFVASVEYKNAEGQTKEETFSVNIEDYSVATTVAVCYVLQIMKLQDFELRIVGPWLIPRAESAAELAGAYWGSTDPEANATLRRLGVARHQFAPVILGHGYLPLATARQEQACSGGTIPPCGTFFLFPGGSGKSTTAIC